ncbi:hypothetical protein EV644_11856 [Kribbella orskensis]|uniref:Uncharacterized protein n=1 Tax=Kribbella orskensis TaxID=2512216 RepID=A0ABY2BBY2_9ACTN|nr:MULTISPECIES: hypothetical protein [Kribbella]TCN34807.1 hypothetical protein EV642_11956 [Kribbella sp. VKM Ac-2500]TCO15512.1 hypothetical protein EV644_11856 [Kribbella orskensis]
MKRGALLAVLPLVFGTAAILTDSSAGGAPAGPVAPSTYVGTATVGTTGTPSKNDGDLWPSCWAGNGNLFVGFALRTPAGVP